MTIWLLFSLLTPFLWGMTHPIDAGLRRSFFKEGELTWFFAFFHLPLAVLAFFIFRVELIFSLDTLFIVLAGTFWTLPSYFYFKSIKFESASSVALLLQLIPVCTLLIAYLFTGENLSNVQLASFFIILFGGILAALRIGKDTFRLSKAFWFMLVASIMWAISNVGFKHLEPGFDGFVSAFSYYFFGSGLPALFLLCNPEKFRAAIGNFSRLPANAWIALLLGRTASLGGSLTLTYALTLGKASLTSVLMGVQPVFALLFGYILSPVFKFIPREPLDLKAMGTKGLALSVIIIGLILLQI